MNWIKIHDRIIDRAKAENRTKGDGVYYECHHIVPKCLGGKGYGTEWKTHPNIVLLTAREHFIIHRILTRIYPDNNKILWAFIGMCSLKTKDQKRYTLSSRDYKEVAELRSKVGSMNSRQRMIDNVLTIKEALNISNQEHVNWNNVYKRFGMTGLFNIPEYPKGNTKLEFDSLKQIKESLNIKNIDWNLIHTKLKNSLMATNVIEPI
jgi:hypothetical protein